MRFVTETVCDTLDNLDRVDAIRAIHEAHLLLSAINRNCDASPYELEPALASLAACLRQAGHWGFVPNPAEAI